MASYFCSKCQRNYPVEAAYKSCPTCQQGTFRSATNAPDSRPSSSVVVEASGTALTTREVCRRHRLDCFMALGFDLHQAETLAEARDSYQDEKGRTWTFPLHHVKVEAALSAGCSHALALEVFA